MQPVRALDGVHTWTHRGDRHISWQDCFTDQARITAATLPSVSPIKDCRLSRATLTCLLEICLWFIATKPVQCKPLALAGRRPCLDRMTLNFQVSFGAKTSLVFLMCYRMRRYFQYRLDRSCSGCLEHLSHPTVCLTQPSVYQR